MASEKAKALAAQQKAERKAEKLRKKNSDDPRDWGRIRQMIEAYKRTNEVDPQLARIVELRYFAGLSELQIAELTERSERSVRRDWQKARMFLLQMLQGK